MIKSVLPQIIHQHAEGEQCHWRLFISGDLNFFDGHFPEQAVLPGVTQLDWAVKLGCDAFGYRANVATLEVLKFQQLILPNTYVDLVIEHQPQKSKLIFSYSDGDKRFASGRIVLNGAKNDERAS
ncbi:ApeI family dehydratase [Shewanella phaeophyticola]|uniref:Thioester dehydrase n=1 Tax=Shewanella phaeophyticola TaxID=2978345 RepID=A0ABT2P7D8_9GAMM|nr:thioester dehydrase [Shewanella sp. KJ10-1]MCT8988577.1 thioester dehydrase [Shewanella sp. KJ10-1]